MPLSLSRQARVIVQSEIRAMSIACEKIGGINLAQGVCDMDAPRPIRQGAQDGIDRGVNSYTRFDGLRELRRVIARKVRDYNGLEAHPDTDIIVSAGATGAFYCACLALLDPGDEVVLFEPYYGYHVNTLRAVGAIPTYVRLRAPDWTFTREDIERTITPRTKAIVVNTPANPSGKVFSAAELEEIAEVSHRYDLFIFTDEIYEHFVYDGRVHVSPGSLATAGERTITISGFSKVLSITGWRIGYSVSRARWAEMIGYMNDLVYVCAPALLQYGVAAGLQALGPDFYSRLRADYEKKRDRMCQALYRAGLPPHIPQGAYYVLADVSRLPGETSKQRAMYLLSQARVAGVPGDAFFHGSGGTDLIRFCFAKTDEELEEACQRLERMG